MPRFRRRRWVRFTRRVKHVIRKQVAPSFSVFTRQQTTPSADGTQGVAHIHTMLGMNGANLTTDDGADIMRRVDTAITGANPGAPVVNQRAIVTGALLETQITNLGTNTVYIDMYYWRCKRNLPTTLSNVQALFNFSLGTLGTDTIQGGGAPLSEATYGVTPFQGTTFAKYCQIWKKTRVKLSGGGVTQVETRSGRDFVINWDYDVNHSLKANVSQGILFIFYGAANNSSEAAEIATGANLHFSTNANYTWRILENARKYGDQEET